MCREREKEGGGVGEGGRVNELGRELEREREEGRGERKRGDD